MSNSIDLPETDSPGRQIGQSTSAPRPSVPKLSSGHAAALVILTTLSMLYACYSARAIAFPIVLSILVAFPLRPLVRMLGRVRVPAFLGATIVVGIVLGVALGGGYALLEPANKWIEEAPENLQRAEYKLRDIRESVDELSKASKSVEKITKGDKPQETLQVEIKQPSLTNAVLNTTGSLLVGSMITVSLVFLLLSFGDGLLAAVVGLLPRYDDKNNVRQMCECVEQTISRYLLTYTIINIGLGVVIGLGLWLMGMPNPVLWGVMAACLNYIPFVGLAVGTAVVFLVALISFDSIAYAFLAPSIYLAVNGIEANIITPTLLGRSMRLNIIIIFLFIVLWGWMWGIGGALIAVPLLAVIKIVCDHFEQLKPVAAVLGAPD